MPGLCHCLWFDLVDPFFLADSGSGPSAEDWATAPLGTSSDTGVTLVPQRAWESHHGAIGFDPGPYQPHGRAKPETHGVQKCLGSQHGVGGRGLLPLPQIESCHTEVARLFYDAVVHPVIPRKKADGERIRATGLQITTNRLMSRDCRDGGP